ncbi:hypothetical protein J5D55_19980, partial [Klebsiella quasipneumoniae subsp. similipneumoniae]|uniref:hypothetical protein n=1 Tax=Klebsiella quasipneumoniae TaxID=1463165 RepID=UPI001ABC5D69
LMMSLWDALRMNMMISYQELVRTFPSSREITRSAVLTIAVSIVAIQITIEMATNDNRHL